MFFVAPIVKREVPQVVGMLKAFKDRVKEKKSRSGPEAVQIEARVGPSQRNPKKRARDGGNTARTYRSLGEMPVPPPSRATINLDSTPTGEEDRSIPTAVAMPVGAVQQSPLLVLRGDLCFSLGGGG